jgi:hypothetical protein
VFPIVPAAAHDMVDCGAPVKFRPLQGIAAAFAVRLRGGATGLERARCLPGFRTPTAHEDRGVYVDDPGLPHPVRSVFRGSHPLDGLLRLDPSGLVSSR